MPQRGGHHAGRGSLSSRRIRAVESAGGGRVRECSVVKKQPRLPADEKIDDLLRSLTAFNERIVELEKEGHKGHAMKVLKTMALDLARQVDELRGLFASK